MTRCKDFYDKWEKSPNWCEKCKSAVSQINAYLRLVDELEERGISREFTMVNLPERAARPFFKYQSFKNGGKMKEGGFYDKCLADLAVRLLTMQIVSEPPTCDDCAFRENGNCTNELREGVNDNFTVMTPYKIGRNE